MKIIWENFTEDNYSRIMQIIKSGKTIPDDHVGSVYVGHVRIDMKAEVGMTGNTVLSMHVYVGGVDNGCDYTTEGNLPFDYVGRMALVSKENILLYQPFTQFKKTIITTLRDYAANSNYAGIDYTLESKMNEKTIFNWD